MLDVMEDGKVVDDITTKREYVPFKPYHRKLVSAGK
jgi:hypothetical protein